MGVPHVSAQDLHAPARREADGPAACELIPIKFDGVNKIITLNALSRTSDATVFTFPGLSPKNPADRTLLML